MKKQIIILIGPPGSGKGTQANLLADKFEFYHLDTSKLIERVFKEKESDNFIEINGQKYYFKNEKKIWKQGGLNSRPFVNFLIKEQIKKVLEKGIILSGSPREAEEAEVLMPFLQELYKKNNIKIFLLDLKIEQSIWRNSHRRICELMRHPILYNDETKNLSLCPLDGSKLIKRKLDKPEIIKKRYQIYEEQTLPIVKYLKENNFQLHKIDGSQSVAEVFKNILKPL